MTGCDHKFVDSNVCAKCGVSVSALRAADAKDWEAFAKPLDPVAACQQIMFWHGAALSALRETIPRNEEGRKQTAEALWQLIPFLKAMLMLARQHSAELAKLWERTLQEPLPFGFEAPGLPVWKNEELHQANDLLLAQYLHANPGALPSKTSVLELMTWSHSRMLRDAKKTEGS